MERDIILSSKLSKRSRRWPYLHRWNERLFVLSKIDLVYYKRDMTETPRERINRSEIISVLCSENAKSIYEFEIVFEKRSMRLRALSIQSRNNWIFYLKPKQRYSLSHNSVIRSHSLSLDDYVRSIPSPLGIIKLLRKRRLNELHFGMRRFKEGVSFRRSVILLREYNKKMAKIMKIELAGRLLRKIHESVGVYSAWQRLKSCVYRFNLFSERQRMLLYNLLEMGNLKIEAEIYRWGLNVWKGFTHRNSRSTVIK